MNRDYFELSTALVKGSTSYLFVDIMNLCLRFSKCASAHMKVSPTDRAHQDEPNHTTFINTRTNPATKNAPEVQKTRCFKITLSIKRDLTEVTILHTL